MDRSDPAYRGQRDYTPPLLHLYDRVVLGPVGRYVWRCTAQPLLANYRRHMRDGHLDVGPGTGYFLDHCGLPPGSRVTLVDPNRNVLQHASRRLRRFDVAALEADVLKPLPVDGPFDSAALNLVLHCLPGPMARKERAVANVAEVLSPDGVLFGATVIGTSGAHTWLARRTLAAFNWQGGFDNLDDSEAELRDILAASFDRVDIAMIGSVAVFAASGRRS